MDWLVKGAAPLFAMLATVWATITAFLDYFGKAGLDLYFQGVDGPVGFYGPLARRGCTPDQIGDMKKKVHGHWPRWVLMIEDDLVLVRLGAGCSPANGNGVVVTIAEVLSWTSGEVKRLVQPGGKR